MMNKYNCDSLKNLPVPDELINKALAIPETAEKAPVALPWYRRTRIIAAAASVVLVTTLGVSVFFLFGNKKPPIREAIAVVQPTEVQVTAAAASEPSESTVADVTEPYAAASTAAQAIERAKFGATEPTGASNPARITEYPTEIVRITSSEAPDVTESEQPSENSAPVTPKATEHRQEKPTAVEEPTQRETVKPAPTERSRPTEAPATAPTQAPPIALKPWVFLISETGENNPSTIMPTQDPNVPTTEWVTRVIVPIYAQGTTEGLTGSGKVYCAIFDFDGNLMGGGSNLSPQRLTTVVWNQNGKIWIKYLPPDNMLPRQDTYTIRLYNEDGVLIAEETALIVVLVS